MHSRGIAQLIYYMKGNPLVGQGHVKVKVISKSSNMLVYPFPEVRHIRIGNQYRPVGYTEFYMTLYTIQFFIIYFPGCQI